MERKKHALIVATFALVAAIAAPALAVTPGTELWVIAATNEGTWVTDLVIHNPSDVSTTVDLYWLDRNANNSGAVAVSFTIKPGETLSLPDVILNTFGLSESPGAIRITSGLPVIATSRIYDQGTAATGTRGQGFDAIPSEAAISAAKTNPSTEITGITISSAFRANFFAVNTSTTQSSVSWYLFDGTGAVIAQRQNLILRPWEPKYWSSSFLFGAETTVSGGTAQIIAENGTTLVVGSNVDNTSGDPNTLSASATGGPSGSSPAGVYYGVVTDSEGFDSGITLQIDASGQLTSYVLTYLPDQTGCGYRFLMGDDLSSDPIPLSQLPNRTLVTDFGPGNGILNVVLNLGWQETSQSISGTLQVEGANWSGEAAACNGNHPGQPVITGKTSVTKAGRLSGARFEARRIAP